MATIDEFIGIMRRTEPAVSKSEVEAFENEIGTRLPEDYLHFLLRVNGGSIAKWSEYRFRGLSPTALPGTLSSAKSEDCGGARVAPVEPTILTVCSWIAAQLRGQDPRSVAMDNERSGRERGLPGPDRPLPRQGVPVGSR